MYQQILYLVLLISLPYLTFSQNDRLDKLTTELHNRVLTLDSHTDTPLLFGRSKYNIGVRNNPHQRGGKLDFPRMADGGLDAVFFAVFVGQGERSPEGLSLARERALQLFESIHAQIAMNSDQAGLALRPNDAYYLKSIGKRAVFIGLENAFPIGDDLSYLHDYYRLGARYVTLSHTRNNDVCDSSTDKEEHGGLSPFGRELVHEMNRIGMMVDVSHISDKAFYDVLSISMVPVIASHSNARAICDHPRNLDDNMLKALRDNGGVVQVCLLSAYVKKQPPNPERDAAQREVREKFNNFQGLSDEEMEVAREAWREVNKRFPVELASVSDLVDHIDHIVNLIGVDYVGIGSDFDGGGALSDCFDVAELPNITRELLLRGYSENDIEKIWSGNFMRVFREVEAARFMGF